VDLQIQGEVNTYLDNANHDEQWEIAGNLTFGGFKATGTGGPVALSAQPSQLIINGTAAAPSNGNPTYSFDTLGGALRDGSSDTDVNGLPRAITYLSPPSLDVVDPHTNLNRYAALTQIGTRLRPLAASLLRGRTKSARRQPSTSTILRTYRPKARRRRCARIG